MRKLEASINDAIATNRKKTIGNTTVSRREFKINLSGYVSEVSLYGHVIARIYFSDTETRKPYRVDINLCGYNTVTTRSRLTAILHAFTPAYGVSTSKGQAFINHQGRLESMDDSGWYSVACYSGEPVSI